MLQIRVAGFLVMLRVHGCVLRRGRRRRLGRGLLRVLAALLRGCLLSWVLAHVMHDLLFGFVFGLTFQVLVLAVLGKSGVEDLHYEKNIASANLVLGKNISHINSLHYKCESSA